MISLQEDRLQELEDTVRKHRNRFRFMAFGYGLLAVGLVIALLLATGALNGLRDTQVATVKLVGRGQVFDCLAHNRLRRNLNDAGIVAAPGIKCRSIRRKYRALEEQARKN